MFAIKQSDCHWLCCGSIFRHIIGRRIGWQRGWRKFCSVQQWFFGPWCWRWNASPRHIQELQSQCLCASLGKMFSHLPPQCKTRVLRFSVPMVLNQVVFPVSGVTKGGGKEGIVHRAPNHCGAPNDCGGGEKSQPCHKYFLQHSTFASEWSGAKLASCPGGPSDLVTSLFPVEQVSRILTAILKKLVWAVFTKVFANRFQYKF